MKQIKIQSGTYQVAARMQFQVSSRLQLHGSWLREELRDALDDKSHLLCHTINVEEVSTVRQGYHYRITFAPVVKNSLNTELTLSADEILAVLNEIEKKVIDAMRTKHLLSGLVETTTATRIEPPRATPRPEPTEPGTV